MNRALFVAVLLIGSACSGSDSPTSPGGNNNTGGNNNPGGNSNPPAGTGPHTVALEAAVFSPAALVIRAGETVIFTNSLGIDHTITPQGHSEWQRATTATTGEVMRVTFNTPGSYSYFCEPHAGSMRGQITVQ